MSPSSDAELMVSVRDGDLAQLGVLFERHHLRVFNLFRRLGVPAAPAEDLVQEVFFRMLKHRRDFRDDSELKPWLYQIARNLAMDHHRAKRREAPEQALERADPAPLQTAELERADDERRMREALASLPLEKREVLVLSRFQLLKHEQIAGLLGCSAGAVKVRIHRALAQLRDAYLGVRTSPDSAEEVLR